MIARIRSQWENISDSLWFVPGLCILGITIMAFVVPEVDQRVDIEQLFPGDAGAARTLLQVVASSLITVISLVFSITILVLQQASQQYTPRLIGNFMGFRGVQLVLGVYLGTFVYALLVLRFIEEETDGSPEYLPEISVAGAILLAVICISLLVYFIHHTAVSLEVPAVTRRIASQLHGSIGQPYPSSGEPLEGVEDLDAFKRRHQKNRPVEVRATRFGFVRRIDEEQLLEAFDSGGSGGWVAIRVRVGEYVHHDHLLMEAGCPTGLDSDCLETLRDSIAVDIERSLHQDPLFGIRQLVDIALRALSPSLNDPTTAEYVLSQLGEILIALGRQPETSQARSLKTAQGENVEIWANRFSFDEAVDESFSQIRYMTRDNAHVTLYMLGVIQAIADNMERPERLRPLRTQVEQVLEGLDDAALLSADRDEVYNSARQLLAELPAGQPA